MIQYITAYFDNKNNGHIQYNRTLNEALRHKASVERKGFDCRLTVREIVYSPPLVLHKQIR